MENEIEFYEKYDSNKKIENPYLRKLKLIWCPTISASFLLLIIISILTITLITFFSIPKKPYYNMIYVGDWGLDSPQQKNVAKMMRYLNKNKKKKKKINISK